VRLRPGGGYKIVPWQTLARKTARTQPLSTTITKR
jgi:hypothetical protein